MHNPLTTPLWKEEDLGKPLPGSRHAVSVALPRWQDVIGYEEGDPETVGKMQQGYPRFVYHPLVKKLCAVCEQLFADEGEFCLAFTSKAMAEQCVAFIADNNAGEGKVHAFGKGGVFVAILPETARGIAKAFWQHVGMGVSSRLAEALLEGRSIHRAEQAKIALRQRLIQYIDVSVEDVYLFPSGAGAIFHLHQVMRILSPGEKSIQLGFPYVDTLKVQEKFGAGVHYVPYDSIEDIMMLELALKEKPVSCVFVEFPSNPLLRSVDLDALSALLRRYNIPLVIDDTLAFYSNIDILPYADVIITSMTKFLSGAGDVMGGVCFLNQDSPFYHAIKTTLDIHYDDALFGEDAVVLERNSRDFPQRARYINETTEILCDWLQEHVAIAEVFYPKYVTTDAYNKVKRSSGGYGGMFSITLKDPTKTPVFYDHLQLDKGPSFGTNFTLVCPYTLLAHYDELQFAKDSGVAAELIRVSVGLEGPDYLISRFEQALALV